jgi:hypothetical protein
VTAKETFSPGDAMRDIYTHGVISGDFVLVSGDLVSNVRIDEIIRVHKERRKTNKDAIMTMVVKESGVRHRARYETLQSALAALDAVDTDHGERLLPSYWTQKHRNVCTTTLRRDTLHETCCISH